MSSLFKKITKMVVQQLDAGGDMIPVRSAIDADRLHCFHLVWEKKTLCTVRYIRTGLTLKDILETEEDYMSTDELYSGSSGALFRIADPVDSEMKFTVKFPQTIKIKGMVHKSQEQEEIKLLSNRISQQHLESLVNRKLKKILPFRIREIRERGEKVYLVTETLMNEETITRKEKSEFEFSGDIPWVNLNFQHKVRIPGGPDGGRARPGPLAADLRKSLDLEDFRNLKKRVLDLRRDLQDLTEQERRNIRSCLTVFLRDGYIQDLEERVSSVLASGELKMKKPEGRPLISNLLYDTGILIEKSAKAIQDLLDALIGEEGSGYMLGWRKY
ncbi:PREDICTED: gasdermin-B [Chrysochloris asiatica]|uniref:Gasdermin-B n=1 Tax=Chrysochloris asiatica TaxID=185453 RepID=A0A9B0T020_CHRAS|nr:PREDICTED: gasdermin-B [Chrysochloris asiatica]